MNQLVKGVPSVEQLLMTLSAVGYMPAHSLSTLQVNLNKVEFLEQAYTAVWWGGNNTIFAFLVRNNFTEDYTLVIRGPMFKFGLSMLFNLYEDLDVARQVSLPYSRLGEAKIAAGVLEMAQGINDLIYAGRTLLQVITKLPIHTKLYATGHSLGGALAAVYAAKASCNNLNELEIIPYTFGAPAVGNKAFADLFNAVHVNCLFTQSLRCENTDDVIPHIWSNLPNIATIDYENVRLPAELSLCIECIERMLILSKVFYVQPRAQLQLKTENDRFETFFREAMYQHQPNTYLTLLGLDPINSAEFSYHQRREVTIAESL